ncbi:LacI family DNA-binding transcriptional regulator [Pandoraea sputorum]|uniref:LacI family DNA-binding transcriptional regulator n=1 Tax=Pandoraea sputorum TaxID=93222 RepID=UPI001CD5F9E9|nr:LacI family DNA-binding transcriptional regulator [Pandoraea sputorum]
MSDKKKSPAAARPTSRDVARLAGVSQSTVSLVFGGKAEGRVTPERREQILQAAQTLGYRPNSSARGLKLGTQKLLALEIMPTSVVVVDGDSSADADVFIASDVIVREMVDHLVVGHRSVALAAGAPDGVRVRRRPARAACLSRRHALWAEDRRICVACGRR